MTRRRVLFIVLLVASLAVTVGCRGRTQREQRARPAERSEGASASRDPNQRSPSPCGGGGFNSRSVLRELQSATVTTVTEGEVADLTPRPLNRINQELKAFTQDYLAERGLRVNHDPHGESGGHPVIEVWLDQVYPRPVMSPPGLAVCLQLRVYRSVTINDLNCWCMVPVWERDSRWATASLDENTVAHAKKALGALLNELCRDADLRANPKE